MVCWTLSGRLEGGTAQALRITQDYNIPIFNAGSYFDTREFTKEILNFSNKLLDHEKSMAKSIDTLIFEILDSYNILSGMYFTTDKTKELIVKYSEDFLSSEFYPYVMERSINFCKDKDFDYLTHQFIMKMIDAKTKDDKRKIAIFFIPELAKKLLRKGD